MKPRLLIPLVLALAIGGFFIFKKSTSPSASSQNVTQTTLTHLDAILACGPRPPGSENLEKSRQYLSQQLAQSGWLVLRQQFDYHTPIGKVTFANLIARYSPDGKNHPPESDFWKKTPTGVLCAHLDSKKIDEFEFLGADDAASACALIVATAQDLAANNPTQAAQLELVFFDGEEAFGKNLTPTDGIYGSRFYASRWLSAPEKPTFGILLDMIGHQDLQIAYPADSPPKLAQTLRQAAQTTGHAARFYQARGAIIDDHVPLNHAGIPTIDIIGDFSRKNWWHTQKDNRDIISAESLTITHQVLTEMLNQLLK